MVRCGRCDWKAMYCPECREPLITNRKIARIDTSGDSLAPPWKEFRGVSLLFDNPGPLPSQGSRLTASDDFYEKLGSAVGELEGGRDSLVREYLFCALPPDSYHVTFLDGVNQDNLSKLKVISPNREEITSFVDSIPSSVSKFPSCMSFLREQICFDPLSFRFERLSTFDSVDLVVAQLQPIDQKSFDKLVETRNGLNERMKRELGVKARSKYSPHVTLGYFANNEGGRLAKPSVRSREGSAHSTWEEAVKRVLGDVTLTFRSVSLYGFTDMANYHRM